MQNRLPDSKRAIWWWLVVTVAIAVVCIQLFGTGLAAHADSTWESGLWANDGTKPDVVANCNEDSGPQPDSCYFHVTSTGAQLGSYRQVSNPVSQCGQNGSATYTVNWSATETTTYSWGNTFTVSTVKGIPLVDGITAGVTQSQAVSNTWSVSQGTTNGGNVSVTVPANHKAWIEWAPQMEVIHGWLEVHYGKRIDGHFFWYYPYQGSGDLVITTPKVLPDGTDDGRYTAVVVPC